MRNVILLTIDACRKDALGCYSDSALTPFLNSIQDHCIIFNNNYSGGPYTQAGFPAILSSSYYLDFGRIKGTCPPGRMLISQVLKRQGIESAAFHSNAYLASFFGWNRGWDVYYDSMDANVTDEQPYIPAWDINKKVRQWLGARKQTSPFFLWVHYMDVHEPYIAAPEYVKAVDDQLDLSRRAQFALFKDTLLKRDAANESGVAALRTLYLAKIREVDAAMQELFAILRDAGHNDAPLIITSDHGDEFNDHGGLSHDGKMYQELVNVPLIVCDPLVDKSARVDTVTSNIDIPPTITHLLGVQPDPAWHGQSLLPLDSYQSRGAFAEAIDKRGAHEKGNEPEVHMYREGKFKMIYREADQSWQLYDLSEDPQERQNIFGRDTTSEYFIKKVVPRVARYGRK